MESWSQVIITFLGSVLASSGLWSYLSRRADKHDVKNLMLIGLAHDRIISLGMFYIERGDWITHDEYENLNKYLYENRLTIKSPKKKEFWGKLKDKSQ